MDMSVGCYLDFPDVGESLRDAESERGAQGDALRDCLATNYDRLHRRLLRFLGCPDQASDCLHDAWLRLGDMRASAAIHNPEAYVFRVACNVAIDRLRGLRLQQCMGESDVGFDELPDPMPGPHGIAEARSDVAAVERALQDLPQRHRAILLDLRVEELTRSEVSHRYGLSLRSVDTALRQALEFCARQTGQPVRTGAGEKAARRVLTPQRLRTRYA